LWNAVNTQGASGLHYEEDKLISAFCLAQNSTRKTALEILKILEDTDKILRKDGKVYSRVYFNHDLSMREEMFVDKKLDEEADEILENHTEDKKGVEKIGN